MLRVLCAALALLLVPVATALGADEARYALVHGCYALQAPSGKFVAKAGDGFAATAADVASGEGFRMQATRLGSYMLYGRGKDYLGLQDGAIRVVTTAGPAADFDVAEAGSRFTLAAHDSGQAVGVGSDGALSPAAGPAAFTFVKAGGCPEYPEAEIDATGPV